MFAPVATNVPRALLDNPNPGLPFEDVLGQVAARHDLALPDKVVPLSTLRATHEGLIAVPGLGDLSLTPWARRSLARILGIRWDRWFASDTIAPADRAIEINRRFQSSAELWKIRSRCRFGDDTPGGDGVLRAFVTPTYAPIDDAEVFETMGLALAGQLDEFRFVRLDVTFESSQYAAVRHADVDLGLAKPDRHKSGFLVANSEVGSRSLGLLAWVWRLVCTNGMVAPESQLFRMVHRKRIGEAMGPRLADAFRQLPGKWQRAETLLREARREILRDPPAQLEALIEEHKELRPMSKAVHDSYELEPDPTRFGIVQALTRAAQLVSPERRLVVEEIAGQVAAQRQLEVMP
jgi:hypothetical protein